jgi:hypothetical protein
MTNTHMDPTEGRVVVFRAPTKRKLVPEYDWDGGKDGPTGKPMPLPFIPPAVDVDAAAEQRLAA